MTSNPQHRTMVSRPDCWFFTGPEMIAMTDSSGDFAVLAAQWDDLPADPYLTGNMPFRFRRHARMIYDAETDEVFELPAASYLQSAANNSLFGGVPRRFAPVKRTPASMRLLTSLVRTSVAQVLRLPGRTLVNLHQIRIVGGPDHAGTPVPEGRHHDGFDFISIHLIGRDVDGGGETTLISDDGGSVTTTLSEPMDTIYADDRHFSHDTAPIIGNGRIVRRDVLLMSYERFSISIGEES
jgi:hypothetical protein